MSDQDYGTTEKVERTDKGYRLTVESTRGTGTRDQDTVKAEIRSEEQPSSPEIAQLKHDVRHLMNERRAHRPDAESE